MIFDDDMIGPTVVMECRNRNCGFNLDEHGNFTGPSRVDVPAEMDSDGAAPPYGPPGGLREFLVPLEDHMDCTECGKEMEEV